MNDVTERWRVPAEQGDAEAQVHVGEIFERGLGQQPNYPAARHWYEQAARQGNRRAQFNLGVMHEQGLGVPMDQLAALNWYRQRLEQNETATHSEADEIVDKRRLVKRASRCH